MRVHHTLPPAFAKRHGFYAGASVCLPPGTRAVDVLPPEEHYLFALDAYPSAIGLDGMNDRGRTFSQIAATLRKIVAAWRTYLDELYPLPATTTENTAER